MSMGSVLTTSERAYRDELSMARMYGLEMINHRTDSRPSTLAKLDEVDAQYPLNDYANMVLGIRPQFF